MILSFFTACKDRQYNFLRSSNPSKCILLQPLGDYKAADEQELSFLRQEVTAFYNRRVIVGTPIAFPASFRNMEKGERYCADSILKFLSAKKNDTIATVVGITHEDIYTTVHDDEGNIKEPAYKYKVWGIFGLGYRPGAACVISDHRLQTKDETVFKHRIRTVVLHEIGHNLGLPHCPVAGCIMSDANEKIATVDNSGNDYCEACKKQLGIQPGISK